MPHPGRSGATSDIEAATVEKVTKNLIPFLALLDFCALSDRVNEFGCYRSTPLRHPVA